MDTFSRLLYQALFYHHYLEPLQARKINTWYTQQAFYHSIEALFKGLMRTVFPVE